MRYFVRVGSWVPCRTQRSARDDWRARVCATGRGARNRCLRSLRYRPAWSMTSVKMAARSPAPIPPGDDAANAAGRAQRADPQSAGDSAAPAIEPAAIARAHAVELTARARQLLAAGELD